ncbi:uncharacterized protein FPRO_16124 [Fusarium proliferatum ET1]|uniref:Uncharacterized protein n=1 Tax=Fusarium proliferatum (strain ET1) TaxID=1227346 RepID=A0A1L7WBQ4_FUSPR|nr:uncharacterized protein FPRO_16124 [Fusarium proliferatum ET1]CZR49919.1 uncharacterized protein FPRO_16124 [Fusarium proliferatum ET1]
MKLSESITIAIAVPVAVICFLILAFIIKYIRKHRQATESDPESGRKALQRIPDTPDTPDTPAGADVFGILGDIEIARRYMEERKITKGWHRTSWGAPYKVVVDPKLGQDGIRAVIIPAEVDESERDRLKREWPSFRVYTDDSEDYRGGPATGLPKEMIAFLV